MINICGKIFKNNSIISYTKYTNHLEWTIVLTHKIKPIRSYKTIPLNLPDKTIYTQICYMKSVDKTTFIYDDKRVFEYDLKKLKKFT